MSLNLVPTKRSCCKVYTCVVLTLTNQNKRNGQSECFCGQTNGRTDGRTDGPKIICPPPHLSMRGHKKNFRLADDNVKHDINDRTSTKR